MAPVEWNADSEIQLFFALEDLPPTGLNKHFNMSIIAERLSRALKKDINPDQIWSHLNTLYNLKEIEVDEPIIIEEDFSLPQWILECANYLPSKNKAPSAHKEQQDQQQPQQQQSSLNNSTTPIVVSSSTNNLDNSNSVTEKSISKQTKEIEKKISAKLSEPPKRIQKRTRGSMSLESNSSPSTTPPPPPQSKRRRI